MADVTVNVAPYFLYDFPEIPIPEMLSKVEDTKADGIEFALLGDPDIDTILPRLDDTGLQLGLLLSGDGDPVSKPNLTKPDESRSAAAALRTDIEHAERLGCDDIAVLVGPNVPDHTMSDQIQAIADILREVAPKVSNAGISLHVEPVCRTASSDYLLKTISLAADVVQRVDHPRVGILYDIYHQQMTDGRILETFLSHADLISYLHVANVPDRSPPNEGELAVDYIVAEILDAGYDGPIGCEFVDCHNGVDSVDRFYEFVDGI